MVEKKRILVVVDMQVDFVSGTLGTPEAVNIVPKVVKHIKEFRGKNPSGLLFFTMDTHDRKYLMTQEGHHLPVEHCIKGTPGWELVSELQTYQETADRIYEKNAFALTTLAEDIAGMQDEVEAVELIGLCTDICVVSNALLIKAACPELPIFVCETCCAGVTPEKHAAAIETMKSCQIQVIS